MTTLAARVNARRQIVVYGVPAAIAAVCLTVGVFGHESVPVLRVLMVATGVAALTMYWTPGRYATVALITSAWLGRAVAAFYGIEGMDDSSAIVAAALWPPLWYLAMVAIFALHVVRVEDRVLGD